MNKKGIEMAVSTLIIIVLSVLVLIALVIILNRQTGFFSDILNNIQGKSNVDSLVTACNSLVTRQAGYDYCCVKRDVDLGKGNKEKLNLTCNELREKEFIGERIQSLQCETAGCLNTGGEKNESTNQSQ